MRKNDTQPGTIPLPCQCEHILRVASRYEQRIQQLEEQIKAQYEQQIQWFEEQIRAQNKQLMVRSKQISMLIERLPVYP